MTLKVRKLGQGYETSYRWYVLVKFLGLEPFLGIIISLTKLMHGNPLCKLCFFATSSNWFLFFWIREEKVLKTNLTWVFSFGSKLSRVGLLPALTWWMCVCWGGGWGESWLLAEPYLGDWYQRSGHYYAGYLCLCLPADLAARSSGGSGCCCCCWAWDILRFVSLPQLMLPAA